MVPCRAQEKQIQVGPPKTEWLETHLLSIQLFCPLITIPTPEDPTLTPICTPATNLLVHPAGEFDEPDQGLEVEGMWTLLERMIWTTLSLVFSSLVSSAGERQGLGREGATSGAARIFPREGRSSYPSNQEVGSLVRTQEGRKKH